MRWKPLDTRALIKNALLVTIRVAVIPDHLEFPSVLVRGEDAAEHDAEEHAEAQAHEAEHENHVASPENAMSAAAISRACFGVM
jgi:hypothetical protein